MRHDRPFHAPLYVVAIFAICLMTLIGTGVANYRNLQILKQDNDRLARGWNVNNELNNIHLLVTNLESSLRGYFISGNTTQLEPWRSAAEQLRQAFGRLERLVHDNPVQLQNLSRLRLLYQRKMQNFQRGVDAYQQGGTPEAVNALTNESNGEIVAQIHALDFIVQNEESAALANWRDRYLHQFNVARWISVMINGVAALILLLSYRLISFSFARQRIVEQKLNVTNDNLESMVMVRTQQLSILSRHLLCVCEEEKSKLARELHDELGSSLTAIGMDISNVANKLASSDPALADQLTRAKRTLLETVNLKRRIIEDLRPSMLDHLGLAASIRNHCERLCRIAGLHCQIDVSEEFDNMDPDCAIALFRIAQEALNNTIKYARASRVHISLQRQDAGLLLRILDDGIGIAAEHLETPKSHGLLGMRERTLLLGGNFSVSSGPDHRGCCIKAFIPCSPGNANSSMA